MCLCSDSNDFCNAVLAFKIFGSLGSARGKQAKGEKQRLRDCQHKTIPTEEKRLAGRHGSKKVHMRARYKKNILSSKDMYLSRDIPNPVLDLRKLTHKATHQAIVPIIPIVKELVNNKKYTIMVHFCEC